MELWKSIEGYDDKYLISNFGEVKSLIDNCGNARELIKTKRIANNGYHYVNLWNKSKMKSIKIHRLVANAFIPNPEDKPQVNHKDGNKKNNHIDNLEWVTGSENVMHALKTGLKSMPTGENNYMYRRHGKNNPHSISVNQYDLNGNYIKTWDNIKEAETGLNITRISAVCRGVAGRKSAGGYIWKYA